MTETKQKFSLNRPQNKLGVTGMIIFIILMDMAIPLATDMYLPAMPSMGNNLAGGTDALVKSTVTIFFFVYALGMLIWGPLSDKYGRKKPMIVGFVLFSISTLFCAAAWNIYILLLARVLQGIGAASITAISFAMINDCFVGKTKETVLAIAQTLSGLAPVFAPIIGSWILYFISWRGIFLVLLIFGIIGFILTLMYTETVYEEERFTGSIISTFGQLKVVLKNKSFTWIVLTFSLLFLPIFAYINLSSYIYIKQFGCTEQTYSYFHAVASLLSMLGPAIYIKFFANSDKRKLIYISCSICVLSGIVMIILGSFSPVIFCCLVFVFYLISNFVRPYATNLILSQNPKDVGSSSSVMNMSFNMMAVVGMAVTTFSFQNMVIALGIIIVVCPILAIFTWRVVISSKDQIKGI
ncbi:multidrug effflux MFS transporter [Clostridium drakei]|uniref:Bcr/CflA family efflux transporter n=1 Tax=Clostridium drakei TaxID=332101 RepID=A0A2U8DLY0_9CLOT|nr:multidrug effflux MFS transporter [Clostridium drakei]AWI03421.1 Bcr/CflA family drug resistance efflux transporter [Clostridium drakei]